MAGFGVVATRAVDFGVTALAGAAAWGGAATAAAGRGGESLGRSVPSGRTETVLTFFGSIRAAMLSDGACWAWAGGGGTGTPAAPPGTAPPAEEARPCGWSAASACTDRSLGCSALLIAATGGCCGTPPSTEASRSGTSALATVSGWILAGPSAALIVAISDGFETAPLKPKLAPIPAIPATIIAAIT